MDREPQLGINRFESSLLLGYGDLVTDFFSKSGSHIGFGMELNRVRKRMETYLILKNKMFLSKNAFLQNYLILLKPYLDYPKPLILSLLHFYLSGKSCGVPMYSGFVHPCCRCP